MVEVIIYLGLLEYDNRFIKSEKIRIEPKSALATVLHHQLVIKVQYIGII